MSRPSNKEIINKVRDALDAVRAGRRCRGVSKHFSDDMAALEIDSDEEMWEVLPELLQEILDSGPVECYAGGHPPKASYDQEMKGMELWSYVWESVRTRKTMWIKFALKKDRQGNWHYFHVDVHENRPRRP